MIPFACSLGALGAVVLVWAARLLWTSRPYSPGPCDMPSPDGAECTGTLAHMGWHHRAGAEWWGNVWRLPTRTVAVPDVSWIEFERGPSPAKILAWVFGIPAVLLMLFVGLLFAVDSGNPPPDDPHAHCAMRWQDAYATHPVCPDSPDYPPGLRNK